MREAIGTYIDETVPFWDPVISYNETEYGWRGITSHGEVLEVKGTNGHKIEVPKEITITHNGYPIAKRMVTNDLRVDIDDYLLHFNRAVEFYKSGNASAALEECDLTLAAAPTLRAKFNRAMILLAMRKWREGLHEYWECEQEKPFRRPQVDELLGLGLRPWKGEPLTGKRVLLVHAHGYGDTIMCLRYVPMLKNSLMLMPKEMERLARQCGEVLPCGENVTFDCDFFMPILHLMYALNLTVDDINNAPYLNACLYREEMKKWDEALGDKTRKRIGVAWSVGKPSAGDYPRSIDLSTLTKMLGSDVELHSIQTQGMEEARECGVIPHGFSDFADCAAFLPFMDEIISVDTAALHLAGAIGHRNVTGLLSHWSSWRWQANWYRHVRLRSQTSPGDWSSVFQL
jgi:hypothetical protein